MRGWVKKGIDAYLDFKTFKTKNPLVIIESDDWGSLRTKDRQSRARLYMINNLTKQDPYIQLDSIATSEDLEALYEVFDSIRDINGNPACITANVCTANPDFEAIKDADFEHFFYEPFTIALQDYSKGASLFDLWIEGKNNKIFNPQLHGREHVHALAWLKELRAGNKDLLQAFKHKVWGIQYNSNFEKRRSNLQASLDFYNISGEGVFHKNWIKESVEIFKKTFGYQPSSFIAPAFTWHSDINKELAKNKVLTIQGIKIQTSPILNKKNKYKKILHYIGQIDKKSNLIFTNRNAFFEPHSAPDKDWVDICMSGVECALDQKKPAIIGAHRLNFIGRLETKHRDRNLKMLKEILKKIKKNYPNVEFIDSGEFAKRIAQKMT
jgi:hypothetical protein